MKNDVFVYYCKCLFQIYGIPVRIFNEEKAALKYELVSLHAYLEPLINDHLLRIVAKESEKSGYAVFHTPNMYTYGYIRNSSGKLSMLIGPSRPTEIDKNSFFENMRYMGSSYLPDRIYKTLDTYMNAIPVMQTGRFLYILSSIYATIYGKIISPEQMQAIKPEVQFDTKTHQNIVKHFEDVSFGDIPKSNYYDFEKRLLFLIRNGLTDQLTQMWQDVTLPSPETGSNEAGALRMAKDRCILAIGIVSNTVLEVGAEQEDIYQLRTAYISQVEQCYSVKEINTLRLNMMVDFCRHVEHLKYKSSDVPIVNYAIQYVNENADKKISLQEIADFVHASKSYLCTEFSKTMGIGLFRYIQEQKIKRAKQFLILTDKPLSEISTLLSFSSQSYFQKIFKEIEGITPKEFRNKSKV